MVIISVIRSCKHNSKLRIAQYHEWVLSNCSIQEAFQMQTGGSSQFYIFRKSCPHASNKACIGEKRHSALQVPKVQPKIPNIRPAHYDQVLRSPAQRLHPFVKQQRKSQVMGPKDPSLPLVQYACL
jgi:hypothetical protein